MHDEKINVEACLIRILQVAGVYQVDDDMRKAKASINEVLTLLSRTERGNPSNQILNWDKLCFLLDSYFRGSNDTKWLSVIRLAKARAISRRAGATRKLRLKHMFRD